MEPRGRIKHDIMFGRVRQLPSWLSDNYSIWLNSSECGTGGIVAIYDCLVVPVTDKSRYQWTVPR